MDILARCKEMEAQGRDVIHMEIGEPDFPTPPTITQAGIKALSNNCTRYTSAQGLAELRQAICQYYQDRFDVKHDADQIFITPGASGALQLVLTCLLQDKSMLAISDPGYPCNRNMTLLMGGNVLAIPVTHSSDFQLNVELLAKNWHQEIAAVLVTSPSNPTGTICSKQTLHAMAEFLARKNSYLIVDEIYQGLTYDIDSETASDLGDNVVVLNSFSKYFGMTGWRIGWVLAPKELTGKLDAIAQNTYLATSTISQYAAVAAFSSQTRALLEARRHTFRDRRDLLCQALASLGIKVPVIPQGAFYVYADVSGYSQDSFAFCQRLLEEQALAITPGCDFGRYSSSRYVRFAYTTSEQRIKEGMKRLGEFVSG